jgi:ferredoxin-2, mitochondrial
MTVALFCLDIAKLAGDWAKAHRMKTCVSFYTGERRISVTYIDKDGSEHSVSAPVGKNLLEVAHDNEIDLEGVNDG